MKLRGCLQCLLLSVLVGGCGTNEREPEGDAASIRPAVVPKIPAPQVVKAFIESVQAGNNDDAKDRILPFQRVAFSHPDHNRLFEFLRHVSLDPGEELTDGIEVMVEVRQGSKKSRFTVFCRQRESTWYVDFRSIHRSRVAMDRGIQEPSPRSASIPQATRPAVEALEKMLTAGIHHDEATWLSAIWPEHRKGLGLPPGEKEDASFEVLAARPAKQTEIIVRGPAAGGTAYIGIPCRVVEGHWYVDLFGTLINQRRTFDSIPATRSGPSTASDAEKKVPAQANTATDEATGGEQVAPEPNVEPKDVDPPEDP
ncbi:MAG: hypothetical protein IH991_01940 [Planctomycetes bacterium]|nr:hypothetical protein [Planctomycetota bacterium]